ncbi:hypothetical protein [Luteimonas changyuni]|uniref:hypothetical protein n=1 Tax=Luteimonas sp. MJ145 TaxID=3129234 RepID=UPI0031BAA611
MSAPEVRAGAPLAATALFAALVVAAPAFSLDARSAEVSRYDFQGAAAICQPATAAYGQSVRSRPLAVVNEGTSNTFVTCALRGDPRPGGRGAMKVLVETGAPVGRNGIVSCTFVDGTQHGNVVDAVYRTKSASVAAGSRGVTLTWQPVEIAGAPEHIFRPAVQCMLSPGIALHYLSVTYDEDVGS